MLRHSTRHPAAVWAARRRGTASGGRVPSAPLSSHHALGGNCLLRRRGAREVVHQSCVRQPCGPPQQVFRRALAQRLCGRHSGQVRGHHCGISGGVSARVLHRFRCVPPLLVGKRCASQRRPRRRGDDVGVQYRWPVHQKLSAAVAAGRRHRQTGVGREGGDASHGVYAPRQSTGACARRAVPRGRRTSTVRIVVGPFARRAPGSPDAAGQAGSGRRGRYREQCALRVGERGVTGRHGFVRGAFVGDGAWVPRADDRAQRVRQKFVVPRVGGAVAVDGARAPGRCGATARRTGGGEGLGGGFERRAEAAAGVCETAVSCAAVRDSGRGVVGGVDRRGEGAVRGGEGGGHHGDQREPPAEPVGVPRPRAGVRRPGRLRVPRDRRRRPARAGGGVAGPRANGAVCSSK
ncbi:ATP-binding cassette sub-family D (ALD) member 3 [Gracilaria domingensis]|nr:ATP-binding cassette sub-family D (ALD) member 3 [Gracilaria domingensis]